MISKRDISVLLNVKVHRRIIKALKEPIWQNLNRRKEYCKDKTMLE